MRSAVRLGLAECAILAIVFIFPGLIKSNPSPALAENASAVFSAGEDRLGKLSSRLAFLANSNTIQSASPEQQASELSLSVDGTGSLVRNEAGQVAVDIRLSALSDDQLQALGQAGAEILYVAADYRTVSAYVAPADLYALAALPAVENITEVLAPGLNGSLGSVQPNSINYTCPWGNERSEGDNQLQAAQARSTYALDGSGVKVGVISDSYNKDSSSGITAADDIASGDLPGSANPCGFSTSVSPVHDYSGSNAIDEGRAMLQIVHDLAPGATLSFATGAISELSFANNIGVLRAAGADIIVDDMYFLDEPFYQDGPISVAISNAVGSGALYFTATGNDNANPNGVNISSYEAPSYRSTSCPKLGSKTLSGDCHDFNPGSGVDALSGVQLASGGTLRVDFQWAEPWYGVSDDFDIYLVDNSSSHNVLAKSNDTNPGSSGTQKPFEYFSYTNSSGSSITVNIVINRFSGSGTPRVKYIFIKPEDVLDSEYNTSSSGDVVGPALFGHAETRDGLSVAAAPYDNATTPEDFSTRGPATQYFGPVTSTTPAAALASPVTYHQPDFAATNGVCTTFFYENYDGCIRFWGTSAAAPHAAAIAALLKQEANTLGVPLSQSRVKSILQSTAKTMSGGDVNSVGTGLLDANAAVAQLSTYKYGIYLPMVSDLP